MILFHLESLYHFHFVDIFVYFSMQFVWEILFTFKLLHFINKLYKLSNFISK